ncbi:MAG: GntR family transcriptional regulator [Cyanobacteria bacterium]|nr:GntR family transcriptional regulator [Cyanobacteriota bacterium]
MSGAIPEGSRIVESALCEELGVSRTPMREALFRLEQEGLVRQDLSRGFSVMPLSAREVREIYPIIWTLEVLALQLTEGDVPIDVLKNLNRSLKKSNNPDEQHEIDDNWHERLVYGCKNKRLLKQIEVLKQAAHRYELAYMRHSDKAHTSVEHHTRIVKALDQGKMKEATRLLEAHWRFGMQTLLDWLDWEDMR